MSESDCEVNIGRLIEGLMLRKTGNVSPARSHFTEKTFQSNLTLISFLVFTS